MKMCQQCYCSITTLASLLMHLTTQQYKYLELTGPSQIREKPYWPNNKMSGQKIQVQACTIRVSNNLSSLMCMHRVQVRLLYPSGSTCTMEKYTT